MKKILARGFKLIEELQELETFDITARRKAVADTELSSVICSLLSITQAYKIGLEELDKIIEGYEKLVDEFANEELKIADPNLKLKIEKQLDILFTSLSNELSTHRERIAKARPLIDKLFEYTAAPDSNISNSGFSLKRNPAAQTQTKIGFLISSMEYMDRNRTPPLPLSGNEL